jgi:hypothetical protein
MMGRKKVNTTQEKDPQYLFFKILSGVLNIDKWTEAFPDVPWTYLYRDSVEIMQSQWKDVDKWNKSMEPLDTLVCARNYHNPIQLPMTMEILESKQIASVDQLSLTEYCAVHLVSGMETYNGTRKVSHV